MEHSRLAPLQRRVTQQTYRARDTIRPCQELHHFSLTTQTNLHLLYHLPYIFGASRSPQPFRQRRIGRPRPTIVYSLAPSTGSLFRGHQRFLYSTTKFFVRLQTLRTTRFDRVRWATSPISATQTPPEPLDLDSNVFDFRWTLHTITWSLRHRFLTATLDLRVTLGIKGYVFHARRWFLTRTRFAI